jgi:thiosulfate/3-mercaptopyruvate sulfurtransferase
MEVDEPRVGLPRGRIENSVNVPSGSIVDAEGVVKSDDELRKLFVESGVDGKRPIVVSCGSGVTACVTGFAAYISGVTDVPPPLYDGAYTEYAMRKLIPQQAQKK